MALTHDRVHIVLNDPLQTLYQVIPIYRAIVAHHGECRDAAALDDHIALLTLLDAAHPANVVLQSTAQAELLIAEVLEKPQERTLDRRRRSGASQGRDVLYGDLADLPRIFARAACDLRIELDRAPVHELEPGDRGVDTPG